MAFDSLVQIKSDFWLIGVQVRFCEAYEVGVKIVHVVEYWVELFKLIVISDAVEVAIVDSY